MSSRSCFALTKKSSGIITGMSDIKTYPVAEYMALVQFHSAYFEFDRDHNYKPVLILEGNVERLDAIDTKFPHDVDTVYFNQKNELPAVRYTCDFTSKQLAELSKKGLWSEDGARVQDVVTNAKFQLETKAAVSDAQSVYDNTGVPVLIVELYKPYENVLTYNQYNMTAYIQKNEPEEKKAIEGQRTHEDFDFSASVAAEVENAKAAMLKEAEERKAKAYVPKTKEQLDNERTSGNVEENVNKIMDNIQQMRDAGNTAAMEERKRTLAEKAAQTAAAKGNTPESDPDKVIFDDTPVSKSSEDNLAKLSGAEETEKYDDNAAIFGNAQNEAIPDNIKDFMSRLGSQPETDSAADDKTDSGSGAASGAQGLGVYTFEDKDTEHFKMRADEGKGNEKPDSGSGSNDSGSGAASGAQGLGVYTFEDKDTAHYAMRADEGKGNEKPEDKKSDNTKDGMSEKKSDRNDEKSAENPSENTAHRAVQLETTINDTKTAAAVSKDSGLSK